ncbi:MAG: hypothetical protein K2Q10_06025 [Rhodospirillales bacterium]|nr:hypothetical protein [Rhodospirillales bacterium]
MKTKARTFPLSADDRRTAKILGAARQVAAEVVRWREILRREVPSPARRTRTKGQLLDAAERLGNLVGLVAEMTESSSGPMRDRLTQELGTLRGQLHGLGSDLMVERLHELHDQATQALSGEAYPIGLAKRLRQTFSKIMDGVDACGGIQTLPSEDRTLVDATHTALDMLTNIENRLGLMELQDGASVRLGQD